MFPIPWNFPFRKKDGSMVNIGDAISGGGGGGYTLPTASADTKGGVKIGNGLSMDGEVLNVTGGGGSVEYRAGETAEFNASANNSFYKDVTFSSPMPDTNYTAVVSMLRGGSNPSVSVPIAPLVVNNKTVNGFRISGYNNHSEAINFIKLEWFAVAHN